jgi:hypothetical protein
MRGSLSEFLNADFGMWEFKKAMPIQIRNPKSAFRNVDRHEGAVRAQNAPTASSLKNG